MKILVEVVILSFLVIIGWRPVPGSSGGDCSSEKRRPVGIVPEPAPLRHAALDRTNHLCPPLRAICHGCGSPSARRSLALMPWKRRCSKNSSMPWRSWLFVAPSSASAGVNYCASVL